MSTPKLVLSRNLRKEVLRGHPWLFRQAFESLPSTHQACLAKVFDKGQSFLCWGLFDPHSPLAVRVLSLSPNFSQKTIENKISQALSLRAHFPTEHTTAFRLINGEGDFLPGLVCDIYGGNAILQFDGPGCQEFWQTFPLSQIIGDLPFVNSVYSKSRGKNQKGLIKHFGSLDDTFPVVKENGLLFKVDMEKGQKTGFFLDQRDNRRYVASISKGKTVLNTFSYTGGFSIYSGRGGAKHVTSMDLSEKALEIASHNWELNKLPKGKHSTTACDVFDFFESTKEKWDTVLVDPPSMAKSEDQKSGAIKKYTHLFANAARAVHQGGDLMLSSCSSHIDFQCFYQICIEALSGARRVGQMVRISGQGPDHPFPLACPEMRYLKFCHLKVNK